MNTKKIKGFALFMSISCGTISYGNCSDSGVLLIKADKSTRTYQSVNEAVAAAGAGDQINIFKISKPEFVNISAKNGLLIHSDCSAELSGIEISKSVDLTIEGLIISSPMGTGISLLGNNERNTRIALKDLILIGKTHSIDGIRVEPLNQAIEINQVQAYGFEKQGIVVGSNAIDVHISDSSIHDNDQNGLVLSSNSIVAIENSVISSNGANARNSTINGFGILIQKSSPLSKDHSISLKGNKVVYNVGNLDVDLDTDISGYDLVTYSSSNSITEAAGPNGFSAFVSDHEVESIASVSDIISSLDAPQQNFYKRYAKLVNLIVFDPASASAHYRSVREHQLDGCLESVGPDSRKIIVKILSRIVGKDPKNIASFLNRNAGMDKNLFTSDDGHICSILSR